MPTRSNSKASSSSAVSPFSVDRRDELDAQFKTFYDRLRLGKDFIEQATDPEELAYKVAVHDFLDNLVSLSSPSASSFVGLIPLVVSTQLGRRHHV